MAKQSRQIKAKKPKATSLLSRELARLDREANERALFSARTTEQGYVDEMQDVITRFTDGDIGEAEARKLLTESLERFGYTPEEGFPDAEKVEPARPGTITDLSSFGRLNLVVQTNAGMAASVARLAEETDDTLDLFPAWRFVRFMQPNGEPRDWEVRWAAAGDAVGWRGALRDEFVALKDSPIWQALGDGAGGFEDTLHNPYPPFAFNSGMGWQDVDREEAAELGLDVTVPVRLEKPGLAVTAEEMQYAEERYGKAFADSFTADADGMD